MARRLVKDTQLDHWADELLAIERDCRNGHPPDLELLHTVLREIRMTAGGYPLGTTTEGDPC
jgi:hypothetical protein